MWHGMTGKQDGDVGMAKNPLKALKNGLNFWDFFRNVDEIFPTDGCFL